MKNPLAAKKSNDKIQELQTVVLIVLSVAVIVLAAVVAVLLAQGSNNRKSIDQLTDSVQRLSTSAE